MASIDGLDCCVGLNEGPGDELDLTTSILTDLESSPGTIKTGATSGLPPLVAEKLEHGLEPSDSGGSDEIRRPQSPGDALDPVRKTCGPLPRTNPTGILEHGPCRHPLAALLVSGMDLEAVVQVECSAACGHRLYSDRGRLECPCHWPAAKAVTMTRALGHGAEYES